MTIRFSTGLRDAINNAIKTGMADGTIMLRTGPAPTNADAAESGTLICQITLSGGAFAHGSATNGLEFAASASGVLAKAVAETWSGVAVAAGTIGHFRFRANPSDAAGSSTTLLRIDGTVGVDGSGADLTLAKTTYAIGEPITVNTFNYTEGNT